MLVAACDSLVDYTVINQSESEVQTVYFGDDCEPWMKNVPESVAVRVPTGAIREISGVAPGPPRCVLVRGPALGLLEAYRRGTVYIVEEAEHGQAPQVRSYRDESIDTDRGNGDPLVAFIFGVPLVLGGIAAAFITGRHFYSFYFRKQRPP